MVVIGIDPDSKAHGVSVYKDGNLVNLFNLELMELRNLVKRHLSKDAVECHIEDVKKNKAVWHGKHQSKAAYGATSQNVAKCKQAQIELERMLEHECVIYRLHKISSAWKKDKAMFEKITGWKGRSNEDTRSAAYFGWLGLKNANKS